ncbi:MAG TPA: ADOP family duplicated permease [Vicinamibacterales bacterium]|nr:ADOP family duplicated permease [Vicinamibacterales bacterium]
MGMKGNWFRRRPSDDEMREEVEAHVAMRAEHDRVDEAAARRRFGNLLQTRESMRRVWIAKWWDALRQDAYFTWRSWRRRPAFALAAVLVLASGLGASTALFAALDRVLFRPLPYMDPDRLVSVGLLSAPPNRGFEDQTESVPDWGYVRTWSTTPAPFEAVTAMNTFTCEIAEAQPEGIRCGRVDQNFLRVLGVRVALGRDFVSDDDVRGAPRIALISHALWVRRYGADPRVSERTLSLETPMGHWSPVRIAGVLPEDFEMPLESADILIPAQLRPLDPKFPFASRIVALGRLKQDVTPERAARALEPQLEAMSDGIPPSFRVAWRVQPLRDRRVGDAARTGWLLVSAVTTLLLIAGVNVTNLLLARVAERRREFALRAAIGAGRTQLVRLALSESLLLAIVASGVGLLVAFGLLRTFAAMAPPGIPGIADAAIDVRVFVVAALLALATGALIGLWPAISVFRAGNGQGLRATSASSPGARPRGRFALVTTQIALTVALLGGSALLLRSLWNVVSVPLGFDAGRVVTMTASLSRTRYPTVDHGAAFFRELLSRARSTPGAVSAALSDSPPPLPPPGRVSFDIEGRQIAPGTPQPVIGLRSATPQYFETFRIPVIRGRAFQEADSAGEPVVVLNESAERLLFAGEPALGRRIRPPVLSFGRNGQAVQSPWHTVIGVIADVRNGQSFTDEPSPEVYTVAQVGSPFISRLSLRTTASSVDAAAYLRQIVTELNPQQFVTIQAGDELLTLLTARPRFLAWLLTAFAALALLLAAAGLYSVASYLVSQRRGDIAVRIAIGAAPHDVAQQVIGEAGRWIIGGAVAGSALGWMGTRALQSQLYQVEALDPWSWATALLVLSVVLAIAVFRPAYRAAHVDPVAALKAD